jgi:tetratricopeptide (TPR) repeat protein
MKAAKLVLFLAAIIAGVPAAQAEKSIRVVRERFANGEAIKLDLQAQEQMGKGDLTSAARTIDLALQKDPTLWLTYFMRARLFTLEKKYELAIQDCNWVLRKYPKFIEAALLRAQANAHLERYGDTLKELDYVIRIRPHIDSYARALQARAWFLATCSNALFRNGTQALEDAKLACKLTNRDDVSAIDALAVAYAEAGDFDSAVRYAEQALTVKGTPPLASKWIQRHLASFKQHKPVRSS